MENPPELLLTVTLNQIKALRDPEWVERERSYHEVAIAEVNSLVRKYNGLAPYVVRRPYYYSREVEIERMYEACAEGVMRELQERFRDPVLISQTTGLPADSTRGTAEIGLGAVKLASMDHDRRLSASWRLWVLVRQWFYTR